jgi:hypothetical protein
VGRHLGSHARADLAERVRLGRVRVRDTQRARRKRALTSVSSSRWAGAMTRVSEDQYQLAMRALADQAVMLRRAIEIVTTRLAAPVGGRAGRVRGYPTRSERWQKQRRLAVLKSRLAKVEHRIQAGRPAITVGRRRLAKLRHNLADAGLTESEWRARWDAARSFLTADGETGAPHGNYTIAVSPTGEVTIVLPEPLRHLANRPRGRFQLSCTVAFHHRRDEWLDRVVVHRSVRYDITRDPLRERWYLDASWATPATVPPTPDELAALGKRLLGVDLNADHLAAVALDGHGNPVGSPHAVPLNLTGNGSTRDGRLRAAVTDLLRIAEQLGCGGIAIENLGFADARATGRETMGRGARGKAFRRTVAGIPTAQFRERLRGMAYHAGLVVVAVDPAYTSRWGHQHWHKPLQQQSKTTVVTRHHAASVAIGRRALGYGLRRRRGVTGHYQSDSGRRATRQAASHPWTHGTTSSPWTTGTSSTGDKTCASRGAHLVSSFDLEHRLRGRRSTSGLSG